MTICHCDSRKKIQEKLNCVHNNPVARRLVEKFREAGRLAAVELDVLL
jgi:hypothetical protein